MPNHKYNLADQRFLVCDMESNYHKYKFLERGPLSLVSTTEELLDRKVAAPV
jgi:hypothetical protein